MNPQFHTGFGNQHPIVPPSLNNLNLAPNPFNMLATMAVIRADEEYSPQSPELSIPFPISTPPRDLSIPSGTFDFNEPRHVSFGSSPSSTPPPPQQQQRKLSMGMSFSQKREVWQHNWQALG